MKHFHSLVILVATFASSLCATAASPVGIINNAPGPLHGSPMQIESCIVSSTLPQPAQNALDIGIGYLAGRANNGWTSVAIAAGGSTAVALAARKSRLTVRLSNEGGTQVTAFRVLVDGAGAPIYEREDFLMQPGQVADRTYDGAGFGQVDQSRAVNCRVDWVQFADGSTWSAPIYRQ